MRLTGSCGSLLLMVGLLAPAPLAAQEPPEALAAYLAEDTVVVVRLDLRQLDPSSGFAEGLQQLPLISERRAVTESFSFLSDATWQRLREVGAEEMYLLFGVHDLRRPNPALVVWAGEDGNLDEIKRLMLSDGSERASPHGEQSPPNQPGPQAFVCERVGQAIFCGSPEHLTTVQRRFADQQQSSREGLSQAFAAVSNAPVQIVVVPSALQRRVLSEFAPAPPADAQWPSLRQLSREFRWTAVGVQVPQTALRIVVRFATPQAAQQAQDELQKLAALLKSQADRTSLRDLIDRAMQSLAFEIEQDELVLQLDASQTQVLLESFAQIGRELGRGPVAARCVNHLKQLGLALHNFHDSYQGFPPVASYDRDGKKLLSWRVYILPFIEERELYEQFHLNEPWDSEHNRTLIEKMPAVFACPANELARQGKTTYLAPVGPDTAWGQREGTTFRDLTDGTSNTVLLLEVPPDQAVIWTRPEDWQFHLDAPLANLGPTHGNTLHLLFADGSVRRIAFDRLDAETLRRLMQRNDGKSFEFPASE